MNMTHLHLILNHIPVVGSMFAVALLAFALWRKSKELTKAAMVLFIIVAALCVPAYLTGEPAEDSVKLLPGISKTIVEKHEDAALLALTGMVAIGVIALAGLIWLKRGKVIPTWLSSVLLSAALIVFGLTAWTANLGGQVRHTEIRSGANASYGIADKQHDHD